MSEPKKKYDSTEYIHINSRLSNACWECIDACPNGIIGRVNIPFHKHARIDNAEACDGCLMCVEICVQNAISANE